MPLKPELFSMAHTTVQLLSQFTSSWRGMLCYKLSRLVVCLICLVEPSGLFFIYLFFINVFVYLLFSVRDKCAVHLRKSFSRFFFNYIIIIICRKIYIYHVKYPLDMTIYVAKIFCYSTTEAGSPLICSFCTEHRAPAPKSALPTNP